MYPVQYLRNKTTARVPDLGPTVRFVGTMAQDLVQKEREKTIYKEKNKFTAVLRRHLGQGKGKKTLTHDLGPTPQLAQNPWPRIMGKK